MGYLYITYLALALAGALALKHVFRVSFSAHQKKSILFSLGVTTLVFSAWDIAAVHRNHWQFGWQHTLRVPISNQPVEEVLFFLIIPFFGILLWEIAGKITPKRGKTK